MSNFNIAYITDCHGQAASRIGTRLAGLFPGSHIELYLSGKSVIESAGNMKDAFWAQYINRYCIHFHASLGNVQNAILCNSAWRGLDGGRETNGGEIVYSVQGNSIVVSTVAPLQLLNRNSFAIYHNLRAVNINSMFKELIALETKERLSFRGLDVIPYILYLAAHEEGLEILKDVSEPFDETQIPKVKHAIWLVDSIGGKPTNIKTTYQIFRDSTDTFVPGKTARVVLNGHDEEVKCYPRLADVPTGELGLYVGSSWGNTCLELGVMDGSAAEHFQVFESGAPLLIEIE